MDEVNKKCSYSFREHSLFDLPTGEGLEHDNDGLIIEIYQNKLGKSSLNRNATLITGSLKGYFVFELVGTNGTEDVTDYKKNTYLHLYSFKIRL